ncbi:MAG: site-2 protease family protein [Pseudomonadales bacterium]|nr:site-2 protease family protein [Pseudomonadales bacterium]MDP7597798.1 site-2 protease family protein [Pseudomonadales bacterium]HJN52315.1 site-2 protease family protein [Pseudomonadales bacterium]
MNGQVQLFVIILVAITLSLTLHEYGHAQSAKLLGDDTAERLGRLTLNPLAHIDPVGLLMVIIVGFGWAKPVPINIRNMKSPWAGAAVAAAGPLMNLLLAVVAINLYAWGAKTGSFELTGSRIMALSIVAQINLLLMMFNLIPLGPLDGHYIMSWLLPRNLGMRYDEFNARFGSYVFLALILISFAGVPIFRVLMSFSEALIPYIMFV